MLRSFGNSLLPRMSHGIPQCLGKSVLPASERKKSFDRLQGVKLLRHFRRLFRSRLVDQAAGALARAPGLPATDLHAGPMPSGVATTPNLYTYGTCTTIRVPKRAGQRA